ncbi:MAG: hypothetical protein NVS9B7_18410 [Flavisolibacter sp.]
MDLSLFTVEKPALNYENAATSFVKINDTGTTYRLVLSDALKHTTFFLDKHLQPLDSIFSTTTIVHLDYLKNQLLECDIGLLKPDNGKFGKALYLSYNSKGKLEENIHPLFQGLQRPVQISTADLNNDGLPDYVICEFGFLTGGLYWMENLGNGKFTKHLLRAMPGAIKAYIQDYNHDGLPDLWVLFAQAEEGIFLFTNKGKGIFEQKEILRFPPMNGSSYFELADFNKDGYPDILYTCGDNADYSQVLKPFHGVYIFLNDKSNHFTQKYFFPINGCYKAIARDFDGDGDLDIATISFFADYARQPEEGFVYLKNDGNFDFKPYSLPGATVGRWLTMDAGDIDGDGKIDLVLGNFSVGPSMFPHKIDWKTSPPVIVLKNTGKK